MFFNSSTSKLVFFLNFTPKNSLCQVSPKFRVFGSKAEKKRVFVSFLKTKKDFCEKMLNKSKIYLTYACFQCIFYYIKRMIKYHKIAFWQDLKIGWEDV